MSRVIIILLALAMYGCTSQPLVNIPIPIPPPVAPHVERPHLPLLDVPEEDLNACATASERCGDLMRSWGGTVEALMGWGLELEAVLKTYQ